MSAARIVLVAAVAENGVIGRDGKLPWRLPSDFKLFRRLTLGKPVVMGRKTFDSLGKPLDGRDNIVISRDPGFASQGTQGARDFDAAIELARARAAERGADEIAIIGGAQIYERALPVADRIYLTRVHAAPQGDTWFPPLDANLWREVSRQHHAAGPKDTSDFTVFVLDRAPS